MKTTRAFGTAQPDAPPRLPISYLGGAAPRAVTDTAPLPLLQALARIEDLERALTSSQQEAISARQRVEILTKANARLTAFAAEREHQGSPRRADPHRKLTGFGLSAGVDPDVMRDIERLLTKRIRLRDGDVVYRVGDGFKALYAICVGSCKTVLLAQGGHDQVAGYHMPGEIVGMDGIATDSHECQAIALEDMEVCRLPFNQVENLARLSDQFGRNLRKLLSQESARAHTLMVVLGTMRAEKRLAVFLLDLSHRYQARGYSSSELVLRMTREEIGSYLGLKLETVSRLFSQFQREGLIQVAGRVVKLLDRVAMSQLVDCGSAETRGSAAKRPPNAR